MTKLCEAKPAAEELRDLLQDSCTRIRIAGSIRRRKDEVKDIELVAEPKMIPDPGTLFEDRFVSALDRRLADLLSSATKIQLLTRDRDQKNGDRFKQFRYRGTKVDLFIVLPPASWGVIYAIRTGPAEFSHLFVTPRSMGGALPDEFRFAGGELLREGNPVPTRTEQEFFEAIGLPWWPPAERNAQRLRDYINAQRKDS